MQPLLIGKTETLARELTAKKLRVATAESCTGGGIAHALTAVAGSSEWFECGLVTYSNGSKQDMLGVSGKTLEEHGAVSEAVVAEMTAGVLAQSDAQLAVAVSGVAGPGGGSGGKPVGTVWLAWQQKGYLATSRCFHFQGDRETVRYQAIDAAIDGLINLQARANKS